MIHLKVIKKIEDYRNIIKSNMIEFIYNCQQIANTKPSFFEGVSTKIELYLSAKKKTGKI